jgi:hypothetical protein
MVEGAVLADDDDYVLDRRPGVAVCVALAIVIFSQCGNRCSSK